MPDKTLRKKGKDKRGQSPAEVDFISHLTVEECLAHLRSGRSPIPSVNLHVHYNAPHVEIVAEQGIYRVNYDLAVFDGTLESIAQGTRICGMVHSTEFPGFLFGSVFMLLVFTLISLAEGLSDSRFLLLAALFAVAVGFLLIFGIRQMRGCKYHWLADYVRERLDVRRDHF